MNRFKTFLSIVVLVTGFAAAPAIAQTEGQMRPPSASVQPTDAQLQKFVQAAEKATAVAEEYRQKVEAAPDDEARQKMIQEAEARMERIIVADGLAVDEFMNINEAIQRDSRLRERVMELANETGG